MALIRPITAALLALLLSGCQATVTLKAPKSEQAAAPPPGAAAQVPADSGSAAAEAALPVDAPPPPAAPAAHAPLPAEAAQTAASRESSVETPPAPAHPVVAPARAAPDPGVTAGASAVPALPDSTDGSPVPVSAPGRASAARPASFKDRVQSGLHTGTVGAAFGGVGGPIGLAAGGGAGFIAGFIAGRPLFGGGAPGRGPRSWDKEVADQQTWEEAVAARAEELDSGAQARATGMTPAQPAPGADLGAAETAATEGDPMDSYEAWAAQVLENVPDASPVDVTPAGEHAPAAGAPAEPPEADTTRAPAEPRVPEEAAAQASGDRP